MKCQKALAGYTIIEVMIFLLVSGGLLLSAMTLISGQQRRTEFTTGSREFESRIQDLINDVETGYFPSVNDLRCSVNPSSETSRPIVLQTIVGSPVEQGTNQDCVYLGKAIQFYRDVDGSGVYRDLTIAGKRLDFNAATGKSDVPASIEEASPEPFYFPGQTSGLATNTIPNGITVSRVRYITSYTPLAFDDSNPEVAVVQNVALQSKNNLASNLGNGRASLAALAGDSTYGNNLTALTNSAKTLSNSSVDRARLGGVICLTDGGRSAAIGLGIRLSENGAFAPQATSQPLATELFVDDQAATLGCNP